MLRV
ncbi:hypothetical protein E2C01_076660 [Portunus trituberculatus]|jgi:hypothetical protein